MRSSPCFFDRKRKGTAKIGQRSEQAGIEKGKLRPQLDRIVFHRRAREHQLMVGLQKPSRLGRLREGILDFLRFIEDDIMEAILAQKDDVAP